MRCSGPPPTISSKSVSVYSPPTTQYRAMMFESLLPDCARRMPGCLSPPHCTARRRLYSRDMPKTPRIEPEHFRQVYERLKSPVSRYDCGRHCAPLNGGEPVCCSTQNAVP